jgi:hypothetical protein
VRNNQTASLLASLHSYKLVYLQAKIIGAEFCVTAHAGLRCDDGKWSRDTQLDCSEATDEHHRGQLEEDHMGHMMPDQDRSMPDHMMHQ